MTFIVVFIDICFILYYSALYIILRCSLFLYPLITLTDWLHEQSEDSAIEAAADHQHNGEHNKGLPTENKQINDLIHKFLSIHKIRTILVLPHLFQFLYPSNSKLTFIDDDNNKRQYYYLWGYSCSLFWKAVVQHEKPSFCSRDAATNLSSAAISTVLGGGPETVVWISVAKFFTTISVTNRAQLVALTHTHTQTSSTHTTHSNILAMKLTQSSFKEVGIVAIVTAVGVPHGAKTLNHLAIMSERGVNKVLPVKTEWRGEVQMICKWCGWCHCHPIISCFTKI